MRRALMGMIWAVPGYLLGAFGGGYLVSVFSANTHDRTTEAAMTGAFILGPVCAVTAFAIGASRAKPRSGA